MISYLETDLSKVFKTSRDNLSVIKNGARSVLEKDKTSQSRQNMFSTKEMPYSKVYLSPKIRAKIP